MVKLNRLTLQGFKSFKNKTNLIISDGITCIAGSNGSGKSNLLDAFSFVLGKNSAKALRADKMEDLIFKSDKGQTENAKVELEIDNSDRKIKVDENTLKIERKVNPQGQSTYRLNNKIETRQRIIDLLREARISPEGLNIVAQGDVTRVLEMNPPERRQIIDELANLAEFDEKKKKSEKELEKVSEILREQNLLLREREKTFQNITEEKRKVEIFNELDEKTRRLKFSVSKKKLDEYSERKKYIDTKAQECETKLSKIDNEIKEVDSLTNDKEQEIKEVTKTVFRGSKEIETIEKQEKLKSEILKKENKFEGNNLEIPRLKKFIEQISEIEKPKATRFLLSKEGVLGTVEQMIKCDEKYKVAIDVALGSARNDLIVDSFDKINFYIKYLKENKIGTAKFLALDKINGKIIEIPKENGIVDVAVNLIKFDRKIKSVIEYVLGSTLVVNTLDDGKKFIKKYRTVTMEGSLIEKSGAVLGGYKEKSYNLDKTRKEIKDLELENKELSQTIEKQKKELEKISKERGKINVKYSGVGKELEKKEGDLKKLREKRRGIYERKLRLQSDLSNEKIKMARVEVEIKNYQDELSELEIFDDVEEGNIPEMKELIIKYTRESSKLGPLNMKAVEDFELYRREYDDLNEKVEKIVEEKYAILKVVTEIEDRRKETFMKLFDVINKEFKDIYHKFTEGEGYISLEDPENVYSGLLIKAKPKGKRLLGIDSLSGGEKTVTAIAFLLAIQRCKPACFCLLDEIDAALDKDNTRKIIEVVKEFSSEQQFIMITHNELTISYSDQVYGIISENGTSSVVGVKLNKKGYQ